MKIDVENKDSGVILRPEGKIIGDSTPEFRDEIECQINSGVKWIILDLAEVPLLDSSALGTIIMAYLKLKEKNGKLAILYAQKNVIDVFKITKLNSIFEIYDDIQEALKSVQTVSPISDNQ
ncbi:MAG: STAS domain-containing protein [Candidatus Poribacteria bacterium]